MGKGIRQGYECLPLSLTMNEDAVRAGVRRRRLAACPSRASSRSDHVPRHPGEPADTDHRRRRAAALLEQLDARLDDEARARLLDTGDLYDKAGLPA